METRASTKIRQIAGLLQRTSTVVFPHARLPGGKAASSELHAGRLSRGSGGDTLMPTVPGEPVLSMRKKSLIFSCI